MLLLRHSWRSCDFDPAAAGHSCSHTAALPCLPAVARRLLPCRRHCCRRHWAAGRILPRRCGPCCPRAAAAAPERRSSAPKLHRLPGAGRHRWRGNPPPPATVTQMAATGVISCMRFAVGQLQIMLMRQVLASCAICAACAPVGRQQRPTGWPELCRC